MMRDDEKFKAPWGERGTVELLYTHDLHKFTIQEKG